MAKKITRTEKMRRLFAKNPEMTIAQVAAEFGTTYQCAYMVKRTMERKARVAKMVASLNEAAAVDKSTSTTEDQNPNGMNAEERAEFMRRVAAQPRSRMQGAAPEGYKVWQVCGRRCRDLQA